MTQQEGSWYMLQLWQGLSNEDKAYLIAFMRQLKSPSDGPAPYMAEPGGYMADLLPFPLWHRLTDGDRDNLMLFLPHPTLPSRNPLDGWIGSVHGSLRNASAMLGHPHNRPFTIRCFVDRLRERIGFLRQVSWMTACLRSAGHHTQSTRTLKAFIMEGDLDRVQALMPRLANGLGKVLVREYEHEDAKLCMSLEKRAIFALDECRRNGIFQYCSNGANEQQPSSDRETPSGMARHYGEWNLQHTLELFWSRSSIQGWLSRGRAPHRGRLIVVNGFSGARKLETLRRLEERLPYDGIHVIAHRYFVKLAQATHPEDDFKQDVLQQRFRDDLFNDLRQLVQNGDTVLITACLTRNQRDIEICKEYLNIAGDTVWVNTQRPQYDFERGRTHSAGAASALAPALNPPFDLLGCQLIRPQDDLAEPGLVRFLEMDASEKLDTVGQILQFLGLPTGDE